MKKRPKKVNPSTKVPLRGIDEINPATLATIRFNPFAKAKSDPPPAPPESGVYPKAQEEQQEWEAQWWAKARELLG